MKIEKLIFRNLNSIQGKWEIDFSAPDFDRSGLFAITGPTGSGKSTILDAIALALYGATPRLGAITESRNEIMSKGTAVCSSEIVFRALGKRYRSSWSQYRSRGRAAGNLQTPSTKLEIFDYETREWLGISDKKKDFVNKVAEATGLTFPQFCRSVLLAQGQFAAFLKASKDEKAQSLEQITGTAIFGEISKEVQKRNSKEKQALEELNLKLKEKTPLDAEHRKEKEELQSRLFQEKNLLEKQLEELQKALSWVAGFQDLLKKKVFLQEEHRFLEEEAKSVEEIKRQVHEAQMAKEIQHFYESLVSLRANIKRKSKDIETLIEEVAKKKHEKEEVAEKEKILQDQIKKHTKEENELKTLVDEVVRPLDTKIQSVIAEKAKVAATQSSEKAKLTQCQNAWHEAQQSLQSKQQAKEEEQKWLDRHQKESALKLDREDIASHLTSWKINRKTLADALSKVVDTSADQIEKKKQFEDSKAKEKQIETELAVTRQQLDSLKAKFSQALNGATREDLNEEKIAISQRLHELRDAIKEAGDLQENLESIAATQQKIEQLGLEAEHQSELVEKSQKLVENYEARIETANSDYKIASWAARRAELKAGSPCPLCGALDHPYCDKPIESKEAVQNRRKSLEEEKKEEEKVLLVARRKHTVTQTQLEAEKARMPALNEKSEKSKEACRNYGESLKVEWQGDPNRFREQLLRCQGEAESREKGISSTLEKTKTIEKEIEKATTASENQEKEYQELRVGLSALEEAAKSSEKAFEDAKTAKENIDKILTQALATITTRWGHFSEKTLDEEEVANFLQGLLKKEKTYGNHQEASQKLSDQVENERNVVKIRESAFNEQKTQFQKAEEDLREVNERLAKEQDRRKEIFQDKDTSAEIKKMEEEGQRLETQRTALTDQLNEMGNEIAALMSRKESLEKINWEDSQKEVADAANWSKLLLEKGFMTEEQWKANLLSQEQIDSKQARIEAHNQKKTTNEAQIKANADLIQSEERKKDEDQKLKELSVLSIEELASSREEAKIQQEQTDSEYIQVSLVLAEDNKTRQENADLVKKVQDQEEKCANWRELNALIGSSEGKVYREFAQGLTFRTLVRKANEDLDQLSSRFKLRIRENTNLELDILDLDMYNQIRPIDNLSGGETFLVSLALALGLSGMAGQRKVRIDSLFLDEGFGTLDDENLQKVLNVLGKLHTQGKLIGVISHVDAIKEAIFPQISIKKGTGGVSTLEGCGIRRLAEPQSKGRK